MAKSLVSCFLTNGVAMTLYLSLSVCQSIKRDERIKLVLSQRLLSLCYKEIQVSTK